jgi:hypothetical protein
MGQHVRPAYYLSNLLQDLQKDPSYLKQYQGGAEPPQQPVHRDILSLPLFWQESGASETFPRSTSPVLCRQVGSSGHRPTEYSMTEWEGLRETCLVSAASQHHISQTVAASASQSSDSR